MNKMLLAFCAMGAVALATPVSAQQIHVSGTATPNTAVTPDPDPGLIINGAAGSFDTNLTLGAPQTVTGLFNIGTTEQSVDWDDLTNWQPISVAFSFADPTGATGSPITGVASGFYSFLGSCSLFGFTGGGNGGCGQVSWTGGPQTFTFGNGGSFSVGLNDAIFATPGSASISGTFTYLTASVPEPATWLMMLLGFGAIGIQMRRRKARHVQSAIA